MNEDVMLADSYMIRRQDAAAEDALSYLRSAKKPATPAVPHNTTEAAPAEAPSGVMDKVGAVAKDIGKGLVETPRAVYRGAVGAVNEALDLADAAGQWVESATGMGGLEVSADGVRMLSAEQLEAKRAAGEDLASKMRLPQVDAPESTTGGIVAGATQFLTGFAAAGAALRGTKAAAALGQWGTSMAAGAVADATVFDEHQARLSNLIEQYPALKNPVTAYLKADPTDSVAEGRFKNALEGLGLGVVTHGMGLAVGAVRKAIQARNLDAETALKARTPEAEVDTVTMGPKAPPPEMKPLGDPTAPKITDAPADKAGAWLEMPGATEGKAININLARLDTPDDVKAAIDKTAKVYATEIDEARRGVVTQQQTMQLADEMGLTVDDLMARRQGQAFNAEEALAARRMLASSATNLVALAKKAQGVGATEVDMLAFRRSLSVHAAIQQQVSGMTAEAGRALAQFRIMATAGDAQTRAIREMLDLAGGAKEAQELAAKVAVLDTPEGIATFVRQAQKATTKDMLMEAWINGLLSGPATHVVNNLSNSLVALWQMPERYLASQIRRATGGQGVEQGEAMAQMFGLVKGARDGFSLAWQAFRTGEPSDAMAKVEAQKYRAITAENLGLSGAPGYLADLLGEAIRLPGRALMASDELFKAIGYRMELNALAFRTAASEGLKGDAFTKRAASILASPPQSVSMGAQDAARYQTFTKPLGPAGTMITAGMNKLPGARLIFPFIRTPTNIMKFVGERTPLAPLSAAVRADIAAGGARRDLALAKISTGSLAMAVAADASMEGHITGGGPTDPGLKAALYRTGWQPYSVKVGDTYYSYNRLDPLGWLLGASADMAEIAGHLNEPEADELAASLVMAVSNNLVNKTYLQGFSTIVGAFNQMSPESGAARGEKVLARFAGTLIPSGAAALERTLDPAMRDAQGMLDAIKARTPGYSETLPPVRNLWGDPVYLSGGLGPDIMSPIYTSTNKGSAIDDEIVRLGLSLSMPTRTLDEVELSPEEYGRYVQLAGNEAKDPGTGLGLKEALEQVIQSPDYQMASDGPDGMKSLIIRKYVQAYRALAKAQLQAEYPELQAQLAIREFDKLEALQSD